MTRLIREVFILIIGATAMMYLLAPSFLPDILPLVGWLDEGLATTIVLSALQHYGIDLTSLFGKDEKVRAVITDGTDDGSTKTRTVRIPREVLERALAEERARQQQSR